MADLEWVVGFHAVLGALTGARGVEQVWLQRGRRDGRTRRVAEAARRRGVPVRQVERERLDGVAGGTPHNGCALRVAPVSVLAPDDLVAEAGAPGRIVLLDDVQDPHNVGAVVRTAAAFEVDGVILAGPAAPPLGGALAKAAAGYLDRVPVSRCTVAADALAGLAAAGYWVVGAEAGAPSIGHSRPVDRWVLCLGSEERGVRAKTRSRVDEWVSVPIAPEVESLNLSVAAGVLLYHMCALWPERTEGDGSRGQG